MFESISEIGFGLADYLNYGRGLNFDDVQTIFNMYMPFVLKNALGEPGNKSIDWAFLCLGLISIIDLYSTKCNRTFQSTTLEVFSFHNVAFQHCSSLLSKTNLLSIIDRLSSVAVHRKIYSVIELSNDPGDLSLISWIILICISLFSKRPEIQEYHAHIPVRMCLI